MGTAKNERGAIGERRRLFEAYCDELEGICGSKIWPRNGRDKDFAECQETPYKWHDIMDGGRAAGFVVLSEYPNCHPDADLFIAHAYVEPEHRRKGLIRQFFRGLTADGKPSFCLLLLNKNGSAREFWNRLFASEGYAPIRLEEGHTSVDPALASPYGFAPEQGPGEGQPA